MLLTALLILQAETPVASEDISGGYVSGTWASPNSPYVINGDIIVGSNDSLIIESGVTIDLTGHYKITVENGGSLFAYGLPGDSIRFTRSDTTGFSDFGTTNGSWSGIHASGAKELVFEYSIIEYIDASHSTYSPVNMNAFDITLRNSVLRNNHGQSNGGINMWSVGNAALIKDNLFKNNSADYDAGALKIQHNFDLLVEGNHFIDNTGGMNGPGALQTENTGLRVIIRNNFFSQNSTAGSGGAMRIGGNTGPQIIQNIIVNNTAGRAAGGINFSVSGKVLVNNIICFNSSSDGGAGIQMSRSENLHCANNIFWGNRNNITEIDNVLVWGTVNALFDNCILEDGLSSLSGTVDEFVLNEIHNIDPMFLNPTGGAGSGYASVPDDWKLIHGSPAINAGTLEFDGAGDLGEDYFGNQRLRYGLIDLGPEEYHLDSLGISDPHIIGDQYWFADTIWVNNDATIHGRTIIGPGTVVAFRGYYQVRFNERVRAEGIENAPIIFTRQDTSGFYDLANTDGRWKRLFLNQDDSSLFTHCLFQYGEGLLLSNADYTLVESCLFSDNVANNYLLWLTGGLKLTFRDNIFRNTVQAGTYGYVIYIDNIAPYVFDRNRIYNNSLYTVVGMGGKSGKFMNNLIYNNDGIIEIGGVDQYFVNNTVVNNKAYMILEYGNARIINNIFSGNGHNPGAQYYLQVGGLADCKLFNNNLQKEWFPADNIQVEDNLVTDPLFINPSQESGPMVGVDSLDYHISSGSPVVNAGRSNIEGFTFPAVDLDGAARIHSTEIDIGAYEHQGDKPVITRQPVGGSLCEGEYMLMSISVTDDDGFNYVWQKDGVDIPGSDSAILEFDAISQNDAGNYRCAVSNSFGTSYSYPVYMDVRTAPKILTGPENLWLEKNKSYNLSVATEGSSPLSFLWQKNSRDITGEQLPLLQLTPSDSSDEGSYRCIVSNSCGMDTTSTAILYLAPEICMVTVSPTTGHNLAVWEKATKAPILAYNIYRESAAAGIYDRLASISYDALSVFVDTSADPTVQAYLYKITAIDTAQNETDIDLCKPHKTIHLLVTTNPELNTTQLAWDRYYGFDYQTYTIYRSNTGVNFDPVHSMSASLNSWTDPDASSGDLFYRIAVEKPDPCVPEGGSKKAGTGPYVNSLSNMDDNKLKAGENPPDSIMLDNYMIDENLLPGSLVGRLTTRDADTMDYYTYHLVPGEGGDDNGSFSLIGDLLVSATTFDYETKSNYTVRIRTTDNAAYFLEKAFTISINDTEESTGSTTGEALPVEVFLDNNTILENNPFGYLVGRLSTADPDTFDVHTYHLVSGTGDDDNGMFMILGDMVMAAFQFDYETKVQFKIRVRSTDLGHNFIEKSFIITVIDVEEPAVGIQGADAGSLSVYPNPFSHATTVRFPNETGAPYRMTLTDLSGKVCRVEGNITGPEFVLNRGSLKKGLYFIELRGSRTLRGKLMIE